MKSIITKIIVTSATLFSVIIAAHSETMLQTLILAAHHEGVEDTFTPAANKNIILAQSQECVAKCNRSAGICRLSCVDVDTRHTPSACFSLC